MLYPATAYVDMLTFWRNSVWRCEIMKMCTQKCVWGQRNIYIYIIYIERETRCCPTRFEISSYLVSLLDEILIHRHVPTRWQYMHTYIYIYIWQCIYIYQYIYVLAKTNLNQCICCLHESDLMDLVVPMDLTTLFSPNSLSQIEQVSACSEFVHEYVSRRRKKKSHHTYRPTKFGQTRVGGSCRPCRSAC